MSNPVSQERFAQMLADAGMDPRHDPERFEELRQGTRFLARLKASVRRKPRDRAVEPAHIFVHPKG